MRLIESLIWKAAGHVAALQVSIHCSPLQCDLLLLGLDDVAIAALSTLVQRRWSNTVPIQKGKRDGRLNQKD